MMKMQNIISLHIDTVATGKNIDLLRKRAGLTVKDIQFVFGFSTPQAIYKWLHGECLPSIDNLVVLSYILKTPIQDIIITNSTYR